MTSFPPVTRGRLVSPTPHGRWRSRLGERGYSFFELLEDRTLLSTFVVTNTLDDGPGSLRQAILAANATVDEPDEIHFDIPADNAGHVFYADDGIAGQVTRANLATTAAADDSAIANIDPDWAHSWFSIEPASALPAITSLLTIDGLTQPGATENTNSVDSMLGLNAVLRIELVGKSAGVSEDGLTLSSGSGGSTLRGLVVNRFTRSGIELVFSNNNRVEGNFVGTDASGTVDLGNGVGVLMDFDASSNLIGGTTHGARNLISGNDRDGISGNGATSFNKVQGNLIGTDITGTQDLGNAGSGVGFNAVNAAANGNVIGGTAAGSRNIMSGNGVDGVTFQSLNNSMNGNFIQGNYIGTDVTGTASIRNTRSGIALGQGIRTTTIGGDDSADGALDGIVHARNVISGNQVNGIEAGSASGTLVLGNFIGTKADGISALGNGSLGIDFFAARPIQVGGTTSGAGNVIAFNGAIGVRANISDMVILGNSIFGNASHGVVILGSHPNPILGNSIDNNGGLGIDLGNDGVTANDTGDADGGPFIPNNLQNFPLLLEVVSTAAGSTIFGTLNSLPLTDFLIQFFVSDAADATGHGEGQTFLGDTTVRTDAAGNVSFNADVAALLQPGQQVTATATRLSDDDADPNTPLVPTDTSEFSRAISGSASILELGQTIELDLSLGQERTFRLNVPPGTDARLSAIFDDPRIGEILVRVGDLPDLNSFTDRVVAFVNPEPEFLLEGLPVPYFITLRGTSTAAVPVGRVTLGAEAVGLEIDRVTPNRGSNAGQVTTTIFGAGFSAETVFSLIGPGVERPASSVVVQSETSFFVTFDLVGLATGLYSLRAVEGAATTELADAFTVTVGNPGRFEAQLIVPSRTLNGRESGLVVEYANTGDTDIPSPLLIVEALQSFVTPQPQLRGGRSGGGGSGSTGGTAVSIVPFLPPPGPPPPPVSVAQVLAISQSGPAGVLPPGAHERIEIRYQDDGSESPGFHPTMRFRLIEAGADEVTFDLAGSKDELRPPGVPAEAWDVIFANLLTRVGTTVGSYVQALRDAATYLSRYGIYASEIDRLLSVHFAQADNALPGGTPHSVIDVVAPAAGVPLNWGRIFAPTISRRFDLGILGHGWSHPWDTDLSRDADTDDVLIRTAGGTRRFVEQDSGVFFGSPLDPAQLTRAGGVFSLRETDGTVSRYDEATGRLLDVTDRNGHRVTLTYTADRLTSLTHSNGDRFELGYNGAGRLVELIDQAGRVTTYAYDAAGEHLTRVTGPDGVWQYAYETASGAAAEHALTSATAPDGTHVFYAYDAQGRLARVSRDGDAEAVTFTYGSAGEVFITDTLNGTTSLFFNELGQLLETRDALDRSSRFDYDLAHRLDRVTLPQDTVSLYDFDANGNLAFVVKPDGETISFTYDTTFNLPTTIRDERGIPLRYTYDDRGNLTSVIHADGSTERFTPDAGGNVTQTINRRDQTIDYTVDDRGLVLRKDHADGTFEAFTYDDRGNVLTATDESGTTTFTHDAADRLTEVTYPDGRFLQYTYDAGGRRTRLEDHTGFVVKYLYDAAGRISELKDGADARLVLYTYDATGRLTREDNGNLTFTTYAYDDADQLTSLVNHLPGGAVSSRFDYTYDALGRRTGVTTLEGSTTFGYDAIGQLTLVALPDGRVIQYEYDAAGNRTAVIDGGVRTDYEANPLNQYVTIGSFDRTYDADGNLLTDEANGATYTYDDESRLLSWVDGVLSVGYEYDALGNRIAKTEGGVRTEYLIDPLGLTDVVAEYDNAGNVIARYVHGGFGLVSRHDAGGDAAFYDFDAIGSTVAVTGAGGSVVNSYSYLPFGEALTITESLANPFEFIGQHGVRRDATGLDFMRARYYSADDGRFISEDPIGVAGGLNAYAYVANQPLLYNDPSGLVPGVVIRIIGRQVFYYIESQGVTALGRGATVAEAQIAARRTLAELLEWEVKTVETLPLRPASAMPVTSAIGPAPLDFGTKILSINPLALFIGLNPDSPLGFNLSELVPIPLFFLFDYFNPFDPDFDFPAPPGDPLDDESTTQVGSLDPNDIIGPAGFGPEQFLQADSSLFYTIRFENIASATAPAQTVVVTQTLDADLDFTTLELLSFGVDGSVVNLPTGQSAFSMRFDLRPRRDLLLDVAGDFNFETGVITWTFTSLDPATLELPDDPEGDIGFLPPNQTPPEGEGFVSYIVLPKAGLPTGTRIDAQARIVFDTNAPIDTPAIFHTLDEGAPSSEVEPLPATSGTAFEVSWGGEDDAGGAAGAGIATFDIFVSDNGGPFTLWLDNTTETSATFTGEPQHTYSFFSVAIDNVGHTEQTPAAAQASTTVEDGLEVVLDNAAVKSVVFTDSDGTKATIKLKKGTATLLFSGDAAVTVARGVATVSGSDVRLAGMTLSNTTAASKLTIAGSDGNGFIELGQLSSAGDLKSIVAKIADLTGPLRVQGKLATLTLRDALGAAIDIVSNDASAKLAVKLRNAAGMKLNSGIPIKSLAAAQLGGDDAEITTPALASVKSAGDFDTDLTLAGLLAAASTLGAVKAAGAIGGDWAVTGGVKSLSAGSIAPTWNASVSGAVGAAKVKGNAGGTLSALSLKSLSVGGTLTDARIALTKGVDAKLKALGGMTVKGDVLRSQVRSAGHVGNVTAGSFLESLLFAGVKASVITLPASLDDFDDPTAIIAGVTIKGVAAAPAALAFADSLLAAGVLDKVKLLRVDTADDGPDFGLAADRIGSVTGLPGALPLTNLDTPSELNEGDLTIRTI